MKHMTAVCAALAAVLLLAGCQTMASRAQKLSLGMTKEQTTSLLGRDFEVVGARESIDAGQVEVLRYRDDEYGELLLYFRDDRLIQWGDASVLDNIPD